MFVTLRNIDCNAYELITTAFSSNHFSFPSRHLCDKREVLFQRDSGALNHV